MQLSAKFSIPYSNHTQFLLRGRLVKKLDLSQHARLTLVSAPPGFGKTALLSSWANLSENPVVWLSLDERDDHPTTFLDLLIRGLQTRFAEIGKSILDRMHTTENPSLEILTMDLIQEIDASANPFTLIIDDYHKITNQQIHRLVELLITHQTPQCRLIISTRSAAPWKLARWQLMGELVEIGTSDLRFTQLEVRSLYQDIFGFNIENGDLACLTNKTEGWIAGLRMLALSLEDLGSAPGKLSNLLESNQLIDSYFSEVVFDRLSPKLRCFLEATSILEWLCPALTDYMLETDRSADLLRELVDQNMFIASRDNKNGWFRYHHLFAETLKRQHLAKSHPEERRQLHVRASRWFEDHNLIEESLQHALAAEDIDAVVHLVERQSLALLPRKTLQALLKWIETLPVKQIRSQPWLSVARCWALALNQRFDELQPEYEKLAAFDLNGHTTIKAHITALRIFLETDPIKITHLAERALECLSEDTSPIRATIQLTLGESLLEAGELSQAKSVIKNAAEASQAAGDDIQQIKARSNLAQVYILEGRLEDALDLLTESLNQSGETAAQLSGISSQAARIYHHLAVLHHERLDLENASRSIDLAYHAAVSSGDRALLIKICLTRAEVKFAIGDQAGAETLIREARWLQKQTQTHQTDGLIRRCQAELSLQRGHPHKARNWVEDFVANGSRRYSFQERRSVLTYTRYLITTREIDQAVDVLQSFSQVIDQSESVLYIVRVHAALALAYFHTGKQLDAMTNMEHALNLAQPHRLLRSIMTAGDGIEDLLNRAYQLDIQPEFVQELLAVIRKSKSSENFNELQEMLSKREYQILKYLVTDLTVPEIADGLVLSAGTVRSHIKRIYRKLDVHRRGEAVAKAREMNLLAENSRMQWG